MARIFSTCMFLVILFTAMSIFLSLWADKVNEYEKDAFNFALGLATAWFTLSMVFIGRMHARGNDYFSPLNLNVVATASCAILILVVAILLHAMTVIAQGSGMLMGLATSVILGGASGLTMSLAKRDQDE